MSPPSPSNRGRGSSGSKWCEYILYRLQREFGKTTSIQVIVISILLYSILSIILIYTHLVYFQETRHSRHLRAHYHPSRGRIQILSHHPLTVEDIDVETRYKLASPAAIDLDDHELLGPPSSVNLLSSHLLRSSELSHRGWFNDHWRWSDTIHCFNSRWALCDKVNNFSFLLIFSRFVHCRFIPPNVAKTQFGPSTSMFPSSLIRTSENSSSHCVPHQSN